MGIAVFGLLAPFISVLALTTLAGSFSPDKANSVTVRGLRWVMAATCGFAVSVAVSVSAVAALLPLLAVFFLMILDPVLWGVAVAIPMGFGGGDGQ